MEIKTTGVYEFRPGYQASGQCIMEVEGEEVFRRLAGVTEGNASKTPIKVEGGKPFSFKVTFVTEAANGLGWISRTDVPGTLTTLVKTEGKHSWLLNEQGNWAVRNDVWYKGCVTAGANQWLQPGCGAGKNNIGPELGFGHVLGTYHDEPVLLIKSSQGNRSLGWDFLPPGGERFTYEGRTYAGYKDKIPSWTDDDPGKAVNWYAGKQYDDCFQAVHEVLGTFGEQFPQWKDQGFEIAGFVWWQGHKDGNKAHASRYEHNLGHLINTLREEFKAPDAPFVLGTIGFDGWAMEGSHKTVAEAQLAVDGDRGTHPEFAGNVKTIETRRFWPDAEASPKNQGFHYHQNAGTYLQVGEALGRGMVELREARVKDPIPPLDPKAKEAADEDVYKTEAANDPLIYDSTIGPKRMLITYLDFEDHSMEKEDSRELGKKILGDGSFERMMREQSYGRFDLDITHVHGWRRLPKAKTKYETKTTEGHRDLFLDAIARYPEIEFRNYDYLVFYMPGKGSVAFGERDALAIPYKGDKIRVALNIASLSPNVLAHELAHCMGLPDLYTYGGFDGPKNPAGPWDIMSEAGRAAGFIGWHRHKFGWLAADRKRYLTEGKHPINLTPLSAASGTSMVVVPAVPADDIEEPSAVYVIEVAQRRPPTEGKPLPPGVLVYKVDATRPTGHNPVVVFPMDGRKKDAPFDPGETFEEKDAPAKVTILRHLENGSYDIEIDVR